MRLVVAVAAAVGASACEPAAPRSQFGEYRPPFKQLRLPGGDTLTVYRVKLWTFDDGSPTALQIEYEPPFAVDDTVAAHLLARHVWPAIAPYLDTLRLNGAILTATNLRRQDAAGAWAATVKSFGIIAKRDSLVGTWHIEGDTIPVRGDGGDGTGKAGGGVFERNGAPLVLHPRA